MGGDHAEARLVAVHTTVRRRKPDGPADVGADLEPGESHCHCGSGAARRSSRSAFDIPRIVRCAEHLVVALVVARPAGHICFAKYDRTFVADLGNSDGIGIGHEVAQFDGAAS